MATTDGSDDQYFVITQDIPKQLKSQEELESLQTVADVIQDTLASGFMVSFALNLLLNGLMSQLWNTFNTMQILLVMPLFAGLYMPSNVLFVQEIVD